MIRCLSVVKSQIGEGTIWCEEQESLYWVDIPACRIYKYNPSNDDFQQFGFERQISSLAPCASGGFVLATSQGFALWDGKGTELQDIGGPLDEKPGWRFNDGKVDPQGRFWVGTIYPKESRNRGTLYRLDPDLSIHIMETNIWGSNGIAWSPDGQYLYYTDTRKRVIYKYDYSSTEGRIANRQILIHVPDEDGEGVPDGLTVDGNGYLWSTRWGGSKVVRYSPNGHGEGEISLPVEYPTSCIFGGLHFDILFVASASSPYQAQENAPQDAGCVLCIQGDFQGFGGKKFGR